MRRGQRRLQTVREVPVRGALRRERLQIRQPQQPQLADLLRTEAEAVRLQEVQAEDRVVHVVVPATAVDPAAYALTPLGPQLQLDARLDGLGQIVRERQRVGLPQIAVDAVPRPVVALLDRFAEHVARDPAQPAPENAVRDVNTGRGHTSGLPNSRPSCLVLCRSRPRTT